MKILDIREYVTPTERVPFREWLGNLKDVQARARIRTRIDRLSLGNFGDVRHIGGGILELRFFFGPRYRIYFAKVRDSTILLLNGGDKQSQQRDIDMAKKYWMNYRSLM